MTHIEKINDAWEMYTTTSWGVTCYDLFTHAGKYRGGKIYNVDKKYVILSGKCELTTEINGKDTIQSISPEDGIFEIRVNTPHIFYFPVNTRMIEWFPEGAQSKNFERYRALK